jgi:hypothetical protein
MIMPFLSNHKLVVNPRPSTLTSKCTDNEGYYVKRMSNKEQGTSNIEGKYLFTSLFDIPCSTLASPNSRFSIQSYNTIHLNPKPLVYISGQPFCSQVPGTVLHSSFLLETPSLSLSFSFPLNIGIAKPAYMFVP